VPDEVREERNVRSTSPHPEFQSAEEELEYSRAENTYLKKLQALIREKQKKKQK